MAVGVHMFMGPAIAHGRSTNISDVRRTCFIGAALQPKGACLAMLVIDDDDHSDWLGVYPG